jgi:hypothetical protein
MRKTLTVLMLASAPWPVLADEPPGPGSVAEAQSLLDGLAADLEAYRNDPEAQAAAPDAIRQADEAVAEARRKLREAGVDGADLELRRARLLRELIAELVEARALERAADELADRVVEALERLAVVRAAYERATEQLHLFAIPMPGEVAQ